jgi:hypothetical protein
MPQANSEIHQIFTRLFLGIRLNGQFETKRGKLMEQQMKEAINAARQGEKENAQRLLVDLLQQDAEQEQAWFLLSHLVDAPQQREAYLGKVLALNPAHAQARQRLLYLRQSDTAVAPPVAAEDMDVVEQAAGDTAPSWMGEDLPVAAATETREETAVAPEAEPVPDWLQEPLAEGWDEEEAEKEETPAPPTTLPAKTTEKALTPSKVTVKKPAPTKAEPATAAPSPFWNVLLYVLILMAVIVAGMMIYLLFFG